MGAAFDELVDAFPDAAAVAIVVTFMDGDEVSTLVASTDREEFALAMQEYLKHRQPVLPLDH